MVFVKGNWLVCADNCDAFTEDAQARSTGEGEEI